MQNHVDCVEEPVIDEILLDYCRRRGFSLDSTLSSVDCSNMVVAKAEPGDYIHDELKLDALPHRCYSVTCPDTLVDLQYTLDGANESYRNLCQFLASASELHRLPKQELLEVCRLALSQELIDRNGEEDGLSFLAQNPVCKIEIKKELRSSPDISSNNAVELDGQAWNYLLAYITQAEDILLYSVIHKVVRVKLLTFNDSTNAMKDVKNLSSKPPPVLFHKLTNGARMGMSAAKLCKSGHLLACGYENSSICAWKLNDNATYAEERAKVPNMHFGHPYFGPSLKHFGSIEARGDCVYLRGHSGPVYDLKYVDSRYLLSCSCDATVRLWDMSTSQNLATYLGHTSPIWKLDTSVDSQFFACASLDSTVRVFSLDNLYSIRELCGHLGSVECVKFHPSRSDWVVSAGADKCVRLWDLRTANPVRLYSGLHFDPVGLTFCSNGNKIVAVDEAGHACMWGVESSAVEMQFEVEQAVYALQYLQDDSMLVFGVQSALKFYSEQGILLGTQHAPGILRILDVETLEGKNSLQAAGS